LKVIFLELASLLGTFNALLHILHLPRFSKVS
jgi:hypothetical protein